MLGRRGDQTELISLAMPSPLALQASPPSS